MRRRAFIEGVAAFGVAWPLAARAQQSSVPVIGFLTYGSPDAYPQALAAFQKGLNELGFVDGQNLTIEYRWAGNEYAQFPSLAADLVRRQVKVVVVLGSTPGTLAAKAATTTIPIVFGVGGDPVALGLVASLKRPGGNMTGVTLLNVAALPKRLGLLHELVPAAAAIALLVNPNNPLQTDAETRELQTAARALGLELHVLNASSDGEFEAVFTTLLERGVKALANDLADSYRQVGIYCGRILRGEKPADLPVVQPTKFEFVINLKTARTLGLTVPPGVLAIADEVIE